MMKRNLSYSMILALSQLIFPLITFPYASRMLGKHGMGSISFIDSFTQYFLLFAALGIPIYSVREVAKIKADDKALQGLFSEIFIIHLLATSACSVLYLGLGLLVPELNVHLDLILIGIGMLFCSVLTVEWFYAGREQFAYIALRSLLIKIIAVIALFLILKPGSSPATYYTLTALAVGVTGLANMFFLRGQVSFTYKDLRFNRHMRPLLIILSSSLAVSVYVFIDNIILGFAHGEAAVGLYAVATKIVKIPLVLFAAINAVIIPKVSHAYANKRFEDVQKLMVKSFKFLCLIGIPMAMGIFISARFLVQIFAGNEFSPAVPTLKILSPVVFLIGFTLLLAAQILTPYGKEKMLLKVSLMGMVISLSFNLLLIPMWSHEGAALTNLITELVVCTVLVVLVKKYASIVFDSRFFVKCLIGTLLFFPIAFVIRSLRVGFVASEVAIIMSCATLYMGYIIFVMKDEDVSLLKKQFVHKVLSTLKLN